MSQFDELLAQLNAAQEEQSTLAKALPQEGGEDDKAIQAASAEGAEANKNPEDEEGEGSLTKSLVIGDEQVDVVDAEQLIKSLEGLTGRVSEQEDVLAKGITGVISLVKGYGDMIKGQGELIKSMQGQLAALGNQGAGRKTVLNVNEPQRVNETMAKSQQEEGMNKEQFMAKSEAAWNANVINGIEYASVDTALRTGNKLAPELIQRIVNFKQ
ncbi:hypothetical protein Dolphis_9 [Pseudomonas phage Dolphis]|nr:hypothetical protein Dolphis_9 [Pseudomonas phage Dolphis]